MFSRFASKFGARAFSSATRPAARSVRYGLLSAGLVGVSLGLFAQAGAMDVVNCEAEASPFFGSKPKLDAPLDVVSKNMAFVFIKPHAVTPAAEKMVADGLRAKGIAIVGEGTISGKDIDEKMLVDQHYYAIASKATLLKPDQLNVPEEKFQAFFGLPWKEALAKGVVYNALDAQKLLGLDADGLNQLWATAGKNKQLIKFGGGFYCGKVQPEGREPIYMFNGFFMSMRDTFANHKASIHYYVVEWDAKKLSWEDFRGKVLGPTNPADAPPDSLRGIIMKDWKALGLAKEPNVGDNGVHASASPFEALAERNNWLGIAIDKDHYGQQMLKAGISADTIKAWSVDPQVTYGAESMPIKMSLFDSLEDTDADMCLARSLMINSQSRN
jgi:nucleoside diphosphate kinase